jgi:hypothetical protein
MVKPYSFFIFNLLLFSVSGDAKEFEVKASRYVCSCLKLLINESIVISGIRWEPSRFLEMYSHRSSDAEKLVYLFPSLFPNLPPYVNFQPSRMTKKFSRDSIPKEVKRTLVWLRRGQGPYDAVANKSG